MKSLHEFCLLFRLNHMGNLFLILITDICTYHAESCEKKMAQAIFKWEQQRLSYGQISTIMQPKWKKNVSFVTMSLPEDGCFYRSCLPMRPLESELILMVCNS